MRGIEQIPVLYDAMMAIAEATGFAEWRRLLVAGGRGAVLDIGCGTGRNLPFYPDVEAAGLVIEAEGRRQRRNVQLFSAAPRIADR